MKKPDDRPMILIVDDVLTNIQLLAEVLRADYRIKFATSGATALAIANNPESRPDLILLDVMMPDMDGIAACRHLKADPQVKDIPIIFVSSLAEVGDEAAGFAAGAVDYIVKPASPLIVCARVLNHLSLVSVKKLEESYIDAVSMLGEASKFKDTETGSHILRMARYSGALAAASGWSAGACRQIELASPMHDIGKLGIPDAIMHKPGGLDAAERAVIETHSAIGFEILRKSSAPILQMAATIAYHHHEKWDGGGYPCRLAGEAIPGAARIVAITDVFDALTTARPYKEAWPLERAMDTMISGAGTHFEPRLINHFVRILPQILAIRELSELTARDPNTCASEALISQEEAISCF